MQAREKEIIIDFIIIGFRPLIDSVSYLAADSNEMATGSSISKRSKVDVPLWKTRSDYVIMVIVIFLIVAPLNEE